MKFGFALSSELHGPRELIDIARGAEQAGFEYALISDHYHPWAVEAQGHSPFVWAVIGGIAQATTRLRLGTGVTCPIMRIHPAIIAHAAATAANLMPGRFMLGLGSGEALNEHIVGEYWPPAATRIDMLAEAIDIIRELWEGDEMSIDGTFFTVENAQIFDTPPEPVPILVAASGPYSASVAAENDGLIATSPSTETIEAFRKAGGNGKPAYGQLGVCWATDLEEAKTRAAERWPNAAAPGIVNPELPRPAQFTALGEAATREQVASSFVCGPDPEAYYQAVKQYADAGFDHITFHQVGPDVAGFMHFFERELAPMGAAA